MMGYAAARNCLEALFTQKIQSVSGVNEFTDTLWSADYQISWAKLIY